MNLETLLRTTTLDEAKEAGPSSTHQAHLDPLSRALLHELTTRRDAIEAAKLEVSFWTSVHGQRVTSKYFPAADGAKTTSPRKGKARSLEKEISVEAEERLDAAIADLRTQYEASLDREAVKQSLLAAGDEQHAIIGSLSTTPFKEQKLPTSTETRAKPLRTRDKEAGGGSRLAQLAQARRSTGGAAGKGASSLAAQVIMGEEAERDDEEQGSLSSDLRSLVGRRDLLALQLLQRHDELGELREKSRATHKQTLLRRVEMSLLLERLRAMSQEIREQRWKLENAGDPTAGAAAAGAKDAGTANRSRIGKLKDALKEVSDKTEMVKGVLRGLVLEGGLDWARDRKLFELMMIAGEEEIDSEDDIDLSDGDEDEGQGMSSEGDDSLRRSKRGKA